MVERVVVNGEAQTVCEPLFFNQHIRSRSGMLANVGQGFLEDPISSHGAAAIQLFWVGSAFEASVELGFWLSKLGGIYQVCP